ncbi:response regulator transcription factor [Alicyclobacillus sp.]|uniref:response regulator transcription factor n=1 Tax=Alicyclobacillus sp. TaxID=61169 RepID=UPI00345A93E6
MWRVMVVDDNPRARRAVCAWLARDDRFQVVVEAATGEEAVRLTVVHRPDLVLMDLRMPGMDGVEATRRIKQDRPQTAVVVLSVSDDVADLFEAVRAGAQGYLVKRMHPEDWLAYLVRLLDGDDPLPRDMATRLWSAFQPAPGGAIDAAVGVAPDWERPEDARGRVRPRIQEGGAREGRRELTTSAAAQRLTAREREVAELVRTGATNREIAARLFISEYTVKNHIKRILAKLGLANRVQLAAQNEWEAQGGSSDAGSFR